MGLLDRGGSAGPLFSIIFIGVSFVGVVTSGFMIPCWIRSASTSNKPTGCFLRRSSTRERRSFDISMCERCELACIRAKAVSPDRGPRAAIFASKNNGDSQHAELFSAAAVDLNQNGCASIQFKLDATFYLLSFSGL